MPMTKKVAKGITENDMPIVMEYIIANNQYIAGLYRTLAVQGTGQCPAEKPRLARSLRKMGRTLTCPLSRIIC